MGDEHGLASTRALPPELVEEEIGLEEVEEELWSVYLYDRLLGRFHAREGRLHG